MDDWTIIKMNTMKETLRIYRGTGTVNIWMTSSRFNTKAIGKMMCFMAKAVYYKEENGSTKVISLMGLSRAKVP